MGRGGDGELDLYECLEAELRREQERFELVAAAVKGVIYDWDIQHNRIERSEGLYDIVGYHPDEAEPTLEWWDERLHPSDRPRLHQTAAEVFASGDGYTTEYRVQHKDGQYRHVWDRAVIKRDNQGRVVRVVGCGLDITERKQVKEALLETNQTLEALIQACPLGITVFNLEGKVKMWNPAAEKIFGWSESEVLDNFLPCIPDLKQGEFLAHLDKIRQNQTLTEIEACRQTKTGELIDISLWAAPLVDAQGNMNCMSIVADITDRKLAEAERIELLEREQKAREKSEAAGETIAKILESITDGFVAFDQEWRFTYINHEAAKILGRSAQKLLGKTLWLEFPEFRDTSFGQLFQQAVSEGVSLELEDYYPPFKAWFSARAYPSEAGLATYFHNITEAKQAQEQLRQSEERLRLALDAGQAGVWDWDIPNNYVTWSERLYHLHGLTPGSFGGTAEEFATLLYPEDREQVAKAIQKAIDDKAIYQIEFRIVQPSGEVRWFSTHGRVIYDAMDKPVRMLGATIDISDRKAAESEREQLLIREQTARAQVEAAQRQLAAIFETSPVGIGFLDHEQRFIAINEALAEINGLSREQHLGYSIPELFCESDPALVDLFHNIYATGTPFISPNLAVNVPGRNDRQPGHYHVYYLPTTPSNTSNNRLIPNVENSSNTQPDICNRCDRGKLTTNNSLPHSPLPTPHSPSPQVQSVLVYVVDITERIRLEEREHFLASASTVLSSSLDYQTTLEQVAQLVVPQLADWCVIDMLEEDGSLVRVATAHIDPAKVEWAYELNRRYPIDLNASQGVPKVLRTGEPDYYPEILDSHLVASAHDPEHLEILREVGFSSAIIVPLIARDRILGTISLVSTELGRHYDLDDLALAEELAHRAALAVDNARLYQIAQRDRATAEAANRMKDEFLATLSHELRTPLNAMLGWTQMLRTRKLSEATATRALETVDRNTKSLSRLIEDLLDVSRIITGKLCLSMRPVELPSVIEAAIDAVRPAAEVKEIEIACLLYAFAGKVSGDPDRLQQVVWNLLSNAVKFTPKGGYIEVRLERIDSHIQIQVSDTGQGIDPSFLPYVFDRFRQGDSSVTRSFGGLGLGMAIVRHLVELHGGTVKAESSGIGQGATFTVTLPIMTHSKSEVSVEKPSEELSLIPEEQFLFQNSAILKGLRILVVDDEADARELCTTILEDYSAEVVSVATANEAIKVIKHSPPDILLSDIAMPQEDGYSLIARVRGLSVEEGGKIPAIALTAYARESDRTKVLLAGFQQHLPKPVQPDELAAVVAALTGRTG